MTEIIKVRGLSKTYGNITAVNGIDLSVNEGDLFAFLGPNGAGKSTTIDILCTLIKCDKGEIIIDGYTMGKNEKNIRKKIGVVYQNSVLDNLLTVRENLIFRGDFYSIHKKDLRFKIEYLSKITEATEILDRPYGKLSGGQKRRVDILRALINSPRILFLDEPTTGLDPKTRFSIWNIISKMQKEFGTTVFLTTHYMEEAANADYVSVICKGNIIEKGTPTYLKNKYAKDYLKVYSNNIEVDNYLKNCKLKYKRKNDVVIAQVNEAKETLSILNNLKDTITSFEVIKGTMDDAFMEIILNEGGTKDELQHD
ncbi:ABC transporter ATP-binding protein [Herbivorax sp. ANBcel31]|uniref:ABC transporter ATP-binding protein n=1 Tax=Herbivorax sp. ANBcel31 TaxID=3069754 RepID=UPI0027AE9CA7|nr:ABC transporter ATP-binding protein [Herbivorax sp. ANBcel31]MDQ2085433.1 ABC transporter ATP-binding protein [Herbivorax sp. ANBcel31]